MDCPRCRCKNCEWGYGVYSCSCCNLHFLRDEVEEQNIDWNEVINTVRNFEDYKK